MVNLPHDPADRTRHPLARQVDAKRISDAITAAEKETTGKIYVTLAPRLFGHHHRYANHAFARLRSSHPMDENGVLLFVVPSQRSLRVLGGSGIHQKVGQAFWDRIANEIADQIKTGDLTIGIVHGVTEVGQVLAEHYPRPRLPL